MKHHGFQPSKLRLYIMYTPSEPAYVEGKDKSVTGQFDSEDAEVSGGEETLSARSLLSPSPCMPESNYMYTKPVVKECVECNREFLAPIEGTTCELADRGLMSYSDPVLKCPLCDENQFGEYLNKDFMADLASD